MPRVRHASPETLRLGREMNRNRSGFTFAKLALSFSIVAILSTGLATPASAQRTEGKRPDARSVITAAEIEKFGTGGSVHDLVHALRKSWLNVQQTSVRETPTITPQGKREALITPAGDAALLVYLDNIKVGEMDELRSMNIAGVVEVRYYNPAQAMRRWGSGHEHGAIEVITTANAARP